MSKHESWRTRKFWEQTGGLLIEEFQAVKATGLSGQRLIDGLIVLNEPKAIHSGNTYDIAERDVIIIQTKAGRLGMNLLGQAYFSRFLIDQFKPLSIRCVAICGKTDEKMEELAKLHAVEVVVIPNE